MAELASNGAEQGNWVDASKALEMVQTQVGGPVAAKVLLGDLLKDGAIRCRAHRVWDSDAATLEAAWRSRGEAEFEADVLIQPSVWRSSRHWDFDLSMWRWPDNRFVVTRRKKPADRTIIQGVQFCVDDIAAQLAKLVGKPHRALGGRHTKAAAWGKVCKILVGFDRSKKLDGSNFKSRAKLVEAIQEKLGYDENGNSLLSFKSLDEGVASFLDGFIDIKARRTKKDE